MIADIIILIDFKTCIGTEKNSEKIGRMFIVCDLEIRETANIIASKNIIWAVQSIKWIEKHSCFLLTVPYRFENIFNYRRIFKSKPHSN